MSEVKIGFEFEFLSTLDDEELHRRIRRSLNSRVRNELADDDHYGDYYGNERSYRSWLVTQDGSLRGPAGYHDYEVISPVYEYNSGMEKMRLMFNWMRNPDNKVITNKSCGFHVNLSLPAIKMRKLNEFKLVVLLDEKEQLAKFERSRNLYCRAHRDYWMDDLSDYISNNLDGLLWKENEDGPDIFIGHKKVTPAYLARMGTDFNLEEEKYRTVNFEKLSSHTPYLEFRIIGNTDYHKRLADVVGTIEHYVYCLKAACKENARRKEFFAKIEPIRTDLLEFLEGATA